jgi:hypothetical protein
MIHRPNILIFSVFQNSKEVVENHASHLIVTNKLDFLNIPYVVLNGVYQGSKEFSILVDSKHESLVKMFCEYYKQECYLRSHGNDRFTELVYKDHVEPIGYLKNVSKVEAIESQNYTYNPISDCYYTTKVV